MGLGQSSCNREAAHLQTKSKSIDRWQSGISWEAVRPREGLAIPVSQRHWDP